MPTTKKENIQYTIEYIDVNNNGKVDAADADLVKIYVDKELKKQYLVPHKDMKKLAIQVQQEVERLKSEKQPTRNSSVRSMSVKKTATQNSESTQKQKRSPKEFKVFNNIPDPNTQTQPVLIQDKTGFGHYIKMGAGLEAGQLATGAVVNAISGLFDGGDEE